MRCAGGLDLLEHPPFPRHGLRAREPARRLRGRTGNLLQRGRPLHPSSDRVRRFRAARARRPGLPAHGACPTLAPWPTRSLLQIFLVVHASKGCDRSCPSRVQGGPSSLTKSGTPPGGNGAEVTLDAATYYQQVLRRARRTAHSPRARSYPAAMMRAGR